MLGRIIALMIFPMILYFTVYPMLTQEVYNAINCNLSAYSPIENATQSYYPPQGETNSFGGAGGNYHFGGYSGEVKHKDFVSSHAVLQTNISMFFNPTCAVLTESEKAMLSNVPIIFLISTLLVGWFWYRQFFRRSYWEDI